MKTNKNVFHPVGWISNGIKAMVAAVIMASAFIGLWVWPLSNVNAQGVGINPSGNAPDPSAMFDVSSTTKGQLMPRMTTAQRDAISSPAEGLQIFNTTTKCFEFFAIGAWQTGMCAVCPTVPAPIAATHTPQQTQITWTWNTVPSATGYKWSSANVYSSATDNGTSTSYTQTGLSCGISYTLYVWAYSACGNSTATTLTQTTSACPFVCGTSTISDLDGNSYNTVSLGSQCWMKENLKTTKYSNGNSIPNITSNSAWTSDVTGAYCDINNTPSNAATYGRLYSWHAVTNASGLCPTGWHVPTDAEWKQLEEFQGMCSGTSSVCSGGQGTRGTNEGAELKESGTTHWNSPNTGTNTSGFTALPAGIRFNSDGTFFGFGIYAYFWTSTAFDATTAWKRTLINDSSWIERGNDGKARGSAVRCIQN